MGQYILSYDIGTSATKATLFSADGKLMGSAVESYPTKLSNFSWAEQDPENWWQAVIKTTNTLMEGISKNDIAVVSLSGQMSGATFLDREGNTVRPTIIWLDNRSTEEVAFLESRMSPEEHFKKSGRVANAVRPMEKAMWVKRNQPEAYKKTYKILQSKDYIAYRLTDCFMTDYSDASSTYLMDRDKLKWSEELFDLAELDMEKFPELAPSTTVAGKVTGAAAKATGLAEGTPVVIGAGDVVAAAVGSKCVRAGQAHICIGSSAWVGVTMEEQFNDLRTYSALHAVPGYSVNICCLSAAGISYKWMKDEICRYETHASQAGNSSAYALINEQIMKNSAGSHGVMYLPFLMGDMCLDKNPLASGSFIGLKTETSRADMLRAVVEGVCLYLDLSLKLFQLQLRA